MAKSKKHGLCKLSKKHGRFVDSHLLPKALTRAEGLGPGLVQMGSGKRQRRWSSWYDANLVTEEGERLLESYDTWAITTLRQKKMVWSGWGPMQTLTDHSPIDGTPWGIRTLEFENVEMTKRLRLFFLSLLWRAAATDRYEFSEVKLSPEQVEKLRVMLVSEEPEPFGFFPTSLTQLSTMGLRHNMAPLSTEKQIPTIEGSPGWIEPTFRFFIDGLIIHFSRLSIEENEKQNLGSLRVGADKSITLVTVTAEASAEMENLALVALEAGLGRPFYEIQSGPFS